MIDPMIVVKVTKSRQLIRIDGHEFGALIVRRALEELFEVDEGDWIDEEVEFGQVRVTGYEPQLDLPCRSVEEVYPARSSEVGSDCGVMYSMLPQEEPVVQYDVGSSLKEF